MGENLLVSILKRTSRARGVAGHARAQLGKEVDVVESFVGRTRLVSSARVAPMLMCVIKRSILSVEFISFSETD